MTIIQTEYHFTAKIIGKDQTPNGTPLLKFDWRLPQDQYDFQLLLGREPDIYAAWNPGQVATVVIAKGPLKSGKDGAYARDFFWNVESIGEGAESDTESNRTGRDPLDDLYGNGEPSPGQGIAAQANQPDRPLANPAPQVPQDDIQVRIEKGMAFNGAYTILSPVFAGSAFTPEEMCQQIRFLRDRLYHEVIRVPVAPPHWCYDHEQPRVANAESQYAHKQADVKGGWCWEGSESNAQPSAKAAVEEYQDDLPPF